MNTTVSWSWDEPKPPRSTIIKWADPRDSGMRGSTPDVVPTKDGLVVAIFVRRAGHPGGGEFARTGVCACVSRDHGQTWDTDHQVVIHDGGSEWIDGYPSAAALPDGSVLAAYGFYHDSGIAATRFHPRHPDFGSGTKKDSPAAENPVNQSSHCQDASEASLDYQRERKRRIERP